MSPKSTEPEMSPLITKRKSPKLRTSICSIDSQKFVPHDDSEVPYTPEEEIITRIAALCKQLWPAVMEGTIDVQYLDEGTFNQIYVISCADIAGQLPDVVLRLPWEDDSVPRTVAILEYLNEFTDLKVPKVINWDATEANALEHDFVILSRIPGRSLQSVLGDLSQEQKLIIAEQLAQLYRQMESITSPIAGRMKAHKKFPSGGRADNNVFIQPFGTEWLEIADNPIDWNNKENGILPIERLRHDPLASPRTPYEYLLDRFEPLQKMVQGMVDNELFKPENDHICLQHPDFFPRNIMIDFQPDPTITGIIDWDDVNFAPRFAARILPRWLWQTGWGDDGNEEAQDDDDECGQCGHGHDWNEEPLDVAGNEPSTPEDAEIKRAFEKAAGEHWIWEATSPWFPLARRLLQFSRRIMYTQQDDDNIDEWKAKWDLLFPGDSDGSEHSED
ncbi:hypothetical protein PG995_015402 [Apiospora arundinis]